MSSLEQTPPEQLPEKKTQGILESFTNYFTKTDQNPVQVQQPASPRQGGRKTKRVNHKKRVIKRKKNRTKKSRRTKN